MQVVLFICELDDIHMKTTIDKFQKCKKEGLIRTLWRNHSNEPKVLFCYPVIILYKLYTRHINSLSPEIFCSFSERFKLSAGVFSAAIINYLRQSYSKTWLIF